MSIVKRLLKRMNSTLHVENVNDAESKSEDNLEHEIISTEEKVVLEKAQEMDLQESVDGKRFTMPQAKLLVVDDNKMNLKVFQRLLKDTKVQIDAVTSGEECLSLAKDKEYDIIFLDHMMPEMDGLEVLHRLRQSEDSASKNVPVIALTANAVDDAREFYLKEGFDDFLAKPVLPEVMNKMILKYLPQEYIVYEAEEDAGEFVEKTKEALPCIEGIDWQYGLEHFRNQETMLDTMKEICRAMPYDAEKLQSFYESVSAEAEESFQQYRIQIHSMKSTANLIGATKLGNMAKALEDAASVQNRESILLNTVPFLEEWNVYRERLQAAFPEKETKSLLETDVVLESLEKLKGAFEKMDVDQLDTLMHKINEYAFPTDIEKGIEKLSVLVTDLEEDEGIMLIEELTQKLMKYEGEKE